MSLFDKYTYIVASCRRSAEEYAHSYGVSKNRFFFIDTPERLRGIPHDAVVWLCGDYYELKNWDAMQKELAARGVSIVRRP